MSGDFEFKVRDPDHTSCGCPHGAQCEATLSSAELDKVDAEVYAGGMLTAVASAEHVLEETPGRMARAYAELTSGYQVTDFAALLKTFPVQGDPGVVVVRGIRFASLCEHHALPFSGTVGVAYIPSNRIVGLSKIPRLVRALSRRLQVQERLGMQVADALDEHLQPLGVLVIVRGRHSCMALRGAESEGEMVTSCVRGVFKVDPSARAEAMALVGQ